MWGKISMTLRSLIWLILLFTAAVAVAVLGHFEKSYIIFIYSPYRIDISLQSLLIIIPIGLALIYGLIRCLRFISLIPQRSIKTYIQSREQTALKELCEAINFTFSGCYAKAEKAAEKAAKSFYSSETKQDKRKPSFLGIGKFLSSSTMAQAYSAVSLIGANAAQEQNNNIRSKAWLDKIKEEKWLEARYLLEAKNYLKNNDFNLAMASLNQFYELGGKSLGGKSSTANNLAWQIAQQQKDWHTMRLHLSLLKQHKMFDTVSIDNLNEIAAKELLFEAKNDVDNLNEAWNQLNSDEKQNTDLIKIYVNILLELKQQDQAKQIIEKILNSNWQPELLFLYLKCASHHCQEMIQQADKWLQTHTQDAHLFYVLGQLCAEQKIWGKAKVYLDQALVNAKYNLKLQKYIYQALGKIHESLDEMKLANQNFRASALLEDSL